MIKNVSMIKKQSVVHLSTDITSCGSFATKVDQSFDSAKMLQISKLDWLFELTPTLNFSVSTRLIKTNKGSILYCRSYRLHSSISITSK